MRTSIARALDALDAFTLRTLEVIALSSAPEPAELAELSRRWFARPTRAAVAAARYDRLRDWVLVWGAGRGLHPVGAVREVLGPYPAGLGRGIADLYSAVNDLALAPLLRRLGPAAGEPAALRAARPPRAVLARLPELIAESSEAERAILDRLAAGPPIGALRNAGLAPATTDQRRRAAWSSAACWCRSTATPSSCRARSALALREHRPARCPRTARRAAT